MGGSRLAPNACPHTAFCWVKMWLLRCNACKLCEAGSTYHTEHHTMHHSKHRSKHHDRHTKHRTKHNTTPHQENTPNTTTTTINTAIDAITTSPPAPIPLPGKPTCDYNGLAERGDPRHPPTPSLQGS